MGGLLGICYVLQLLLRVVTCVTLGMYTLWLFVCLDNLRATALCAVPGFLFKQTGAALLMYVMATNLRGSEDVLSAV